MGYKINIIGTSQEAAEKLEILANAGGGSYQLLSSSDTDIAPLVQKLRNNQNQLEIGKNWMSIWLDYGYFLVIVPLLCCLYFFRQGIMIIVFLCVMTANANASFFFNQNQDGLIAFNEENYE